MSERFRLFVYGHLQRGQVGYERLGLVKNTQWLGEAQVQGRLYEIGDYPGLILDGEEVVKGELIAFDDTALWAALDDYEDCDRDDPETSEYRRVEIDMLGGGRAWVYVYNRSVDDLVMIASGRWAAS